MTILEFLETLDKTNDLNDIISLFHLYTSSYVVEDIRHEQFNSQIKNFIQQIDGDKFTSFGSKLGRCSSACDDELKRAENLKIPGGRQLYESVKSIIQQVSAIYSEIADDKYKKPDYIKDAVEQHEDSLLEVKEKISKLNINVEKAQDMIDGKIFNLLINTVAILGIFVAIAFTGFSITSIFSNIKLGIALQSEEAFAKCSFFLLLVSLVAYNFLLLLIYFILKLSRPIFDKSQNNSIPGSDKFVKAIGMTPFLWVNAFLAIFTVGFFLFCYFFW